jgi:hypothetical protein
VLVVIAGLVGVVVGGIAVVISCFFLPVGVVIGGIVGVLFGGLLSLAPISLACSARFLLPVGGCHRRATLSSFSFSCLSFMLSLALFYHLSKLTSTTLLRYRQSYVQSWALLLLHMNR